VNTANIKIIAADDVKNNLTLLYCDECFTKLFQLELFDNFPNKKDNNEHLRTSKNFAEVRKYSNLGKKENSTMSNATKQVIEEVTATIEINDEFTLQPDELTKKQVADKCNTSTKSVENWVKAGKLTQAELRRRVNGIVKPTLIYSLIQVEKMLSGEPEEKPETNESTALEVIQPANDTFAANSQFMVAEILMKISDKLITPDNKKFLGLREVTKEFGLSSTILKILIKKNRLENFGTKSKVLLSRKQIENL
jgi:hypothetical protein